MRLTLTFLQLVLMENVNSSIRNTFCALNYSVAFAIAALINFISNLMGFTVNSSIMINQFSSVTMLILIILFIQREEKLNAKAE